MSNSPEDKAETLDNDDAILAAMEEAANELGLDDELRGTEDSPDHIKPEPTTEKPKRGRPRKIQAKEEEESADDVEKQIEEEVEAVLDAEIEDEETPEEVNSGESNDEPSTDADPVGEGEDGTEAPVFWSEERKELFKKADPALKKAVAEDFDILGTHIANLTHNQQVYKSAIDNIQEIFKPMASEMAERGLDPLKVSKQMVQWHQDIKREGVEKGLRFLETYGITPEKIVRYLEGAEDPRASNYDPRVEAKIQELKEKTKEFEDWKAKQDELFAQQKNHALQSVLENFKSETTPDGRKKRPNFDLYEPQMAQMIQSLKVRYPQMSQRQLLDASYDAVDKQMRQRFGASSKPAPKVAAKPTPQDIRAKAAAGLSVKGYSPKAKQTISSTDDAIWSSMDELGFN